MKLEQDERLLQLVTDALRDGPGSPTWDRAVGAVGAEGGDELARLGEVRQRLESGKRWRQVRPGVNFTRKVMDAVDQQSDASVRATGPATIIAILSGVLVLIVLIALIPMLFSPAKPPATTGDPFANIFFSTQLIESDFANTIGGEWKITGKALIRARHGLRATQPASEAPSPWGLISTQPLSAEQFFSYSATIDVPNNGSVGNVFVSDGDNKLIAMVCSNQVQVVLPGGRTIPIAGKTDRSQWHLRWLVSPASAALEIEGRRVWLGTNDLSPVAPRSVGIDFLPVAKEGHNAVIENIEVRTKN